MTKFIAISLLIFSSIICHGQTNSESNYSPAKKKGKWGYVQKLTSKQLIPFQFQKAREFSGNRAAVKKNGKWGFIDTKGEVKVGFKYDEVKYFFYDYCEVRIDELWGVIDKNGKEIIPIVCDEISPWDNKGSLLVSKNGKNGIFNISNGINIPSLYDEITLLNQGGLLLVSKNGEKGIVSYSHEIFLPCLYDEIYLHSYLDFVTVQKEGGAAFLNREFQFITDFDYDPFFNEIFIGRLVRKDGFYGVLNDSGKIAVPIIYDEIVTFGMDGVEGSYFSCTKNGKVGLININGKVLVPPKYDLVHPIFDISRDSKTPDLLYAYDLLSTIVKEDGKYSILRQGIPNSIKYDSILFYCSGNSIESSYNCWELEMPNETEEAEGNRYDLKTHMENFSYFSLYWRNENHPFLIYENNNNFGIMHVNGDELTEAVYSLEYLRNNFPYYQWIDKTWFFEGEMIYKNE